MMLLTKEKPMRAKRVATLTVICMVSCRMTSGRAQAPQQKATAIGAVGIIVPTVDTVEKAQAAVKWSKYPPEGRRSRGNGQYGALWGNDYRQTANENMVVVIMIETPIGVENAEKIASVPGID